MSRALAIAFLGVALITVGLLNVNAAGTATAAKIGYVDLQRTLHETKIGKKAKKKLEADKAKKQKELDKAQKELQEFAMELEKQRAVLKPNVLRQREAELQQRYIALQEQYLKLQQELAQMEAELVNDILEKAGPVIEAIGKRDGYTLLLEKTESAVLWAADGSDITDEVNGALDKGK